MEINYKNEIYKIIEISYKHKVSHIPSALSQMLYFKHIIPRVKDFDWVAGKQFGWQARALELVWNDQDAHRDGEGLHGSGGGRGFLRGRVSPLRFWFTRRIKPVTFNTGWM